MTTPGTEDRGVQLSLFSVTADHVVLAEGKDDVDLSRHLLGPRRGRVQLHDARGRDNVLALIALIALDRRFRRSGRSLGVIVDADDDPAQMFTLVAAALGSAGLPQPTAPETIATSPDGLISTGVFVAPGQGRNGAVEGLYLPTVDPDRRRLAGDYLAQVTGAGLPALKNAEKGELPSVLAALPRSPRQPGEGLQHGLVHDDTTLEPLQGFLRQLTDEPESRSSG